ncbi:MAG: hypothetical protein KGQ48_17040, partial [Bradyrhizobium sp.]|nr:hypothetical protein [Bradyrhizobium sp.]
MSWRVWEIAPVEQRLDRKSRTAGIGREILISHSALKLLSPATTAHLFQRRGTIVVAEILL